MSPYRGTDEALDREITAVERLVRVRLRRANDDLKELDAVLRELRRERRRRRADSFVQTPEPVTVDATAR